VNEVTHRPADTATHLEPDTGHGAMGAKKAKRLPAPVRIAVHSLRRRLADSDGISAKACIDGLVKAGLLKDDSPEYVKEVRFSQEKAQDEKTIITLEAAR
jgi:hypothetical protein